MKTPEVVRELRARYDLSQQKLAVVMNVSLRSVESWEQGTREPHGAAARLLQLLNTDGEAIKALEKIESSDVSLDLDTDAAKMTIMGVPFADRTEYRAALNAIVNNMYEGFRPTKADVEFFAEHVSQPVDPKDVLEWVKANHGELFHGNK
jgi:putative transcriptional regulator